MLSSSQRSAVPAPADAVLDGLKNCDLFHYCGHSFFRGEGDDKSGLFLAGFKKLTLDDVRNLGSVPRLAFVNSCEGGRTRGELRPKEHDASSFAEFFLGMGIEAYIGTYWEVTDIGAFDFARATYGVLAQGETLDKAVLEGRKTLFNAEHKDWANYMLYSRNANFRLVR